VRSAAPSRAPGVSAPDPQLRLTRSGRQLAVQWNADRFPMVMVRDGQSGELLAFVRGGTARVRSQRSDVELVFSDRVRSTSRRASPR
jgi:hypothetical protein